jgi:hypothetical protein
MKNKNLMEGTSSSKHAYLYCNVTLSALRFLKFAVESMYIAAVKRK